MKIIIGFIISSILFFEFLLAIYVQITEESNSILLKAISSPITASWIQAIGSVASVIGLIYTFHKQNELHQKEIHDKQRKKIKDKKQTQVITGLFICQQIIFLLSEVITFVESQNNNPLPRQESRNDLLAVHLLERLWKIEERICNLPYLDPYYSKMLYAILFARNLLQYLQRILIAPNLQKFSFFKNEKALLNKEMQKLQKQCEIILKLQQEIVSDFRQFTQSK